MTVPAPRRSALRGGISRALAVGLLASLGVVAPVVGASAAPEPLTPDAQTLDVPEVTSETGAPGTALLTPQAAAEVSASEEAPVARSGPTATDDFQMLTVHWDADAAPAAPAGEDVPAVDATAAASEDAAVQVRVRTDGAWSGWQDLAVEDSGPDAGSADAEGATGVVATEALWVGADADGVDVRVAGEQVVATSDVSVTLIDPQTVDADRGIVPAATASAATVGVPNIISRAQWGADENLRLDRCKDVSYTGTPRVAFVHHTAGSNDYTAAQSAAIVRGIYYQHTVVQGWCDLGYNFLVDKYGQIFEGRFGGLDKAVLGAHAAGFNANSFGVSVLGNYSTAQPTPAITDALARVISWKLGLDQTSSTGTAVLVSAGKTGTSKFDDGVAVTMPVITGHRTVGATECPGTYLNAALPALRGKVAAMMAEKWWELKDTASAGSANHQVHYGGPGDAALACDWDGDGVDGVTVYSRGTWYLRDDATTGGAESVVSYGSGSMVPVCGDWNGDGKDSIGVYEPSTGLWWLRNSATAGDPDLKFQYGGFRGALPVVGDWDGVGRDGIGVYDSGTWYLRGTASAGGAGAVFGFGWSAAAPVVGDWNGDGTESIGVYSRGAWYLRENITGGDPDRRFDYGAPQDTGVVGTWDRGRTGVGVWRPWA